MKVSVHDQSQIEFTADYTWNVSARQANFVLDFFFFLPRNVGVTSSSYGRDQFYNDLTNYTRFHTPYHAESEEDILLDIQKHLSGNVTALDLEQATPYLIQQTKLLGSHVGHRLKLFLDTAHALAAKGDMEGRDSFTHELQDIKSIIGEYRKSCIALVREYGIKADNKLRNAIILTDEYISNRFEATMSRVHHVFAKAWASDEKFWQPLVEVITVSLHNEGNYRDESVGRYFNSKKTEADKEYYYYRHGLLKKYISQILYIGSSRHRQERVYRNWIAGTGAFLAGAWARIADLQSYKLAKTNDYGFNFVFVVLLGILAYVFKDRIKDVSKDYFNEKLKRFLPDFKIKLDYKIIVPSLKEVSLELGQCQEFVRYLDYQHVPQEIMYLRTLWSKKDVVRPNPDVVLHYERAVKLNMQPLTSELQGVHAIKDIFRYNFNYFFNRLDDALKNLSVFDITEGAAQIEAPKVYHINIIVKQTTGTIVSFSHYRVVLSKTGIVRLDKISEPGQFTYDESAP